MQKNFPVRPLKVFKSSRQQIISLFEFLTFHAHVFHLSQAKDLVNFINLPSMQLTYTAYFLYNFKTY